MKILHTADWHLGKLVQGVSMIQDQAYILKELLQEIDKHQPDLVIIAGDLYDRAVPPPEAIKLLDETLYTIVHELQIPVLAIGGNHDSPNRLQFGSSFMQESGFHIAGMIDKTIPQVVIEDEHGPVHFYLVPFMDPSQVRTIFDDDQIRTFDDAMGKIVEVIQEEMNEKARHVFIGHAFVTPGGKVEPNTSDSEKPLSIGGVEYVNSDHFKPFHYTALGHLHQAHHVGDETIRYAGSILKYSLSEENHKKGFLLIDMDGKGKTTINKHPLLPMRELRRVRGSLEEILASERSDDYVYVELTDEQVVLQPMEKIRTVFPNAMQVKRVNDPLIRQLTKQEEEKEVRALTDVELFHAFYKEITGKSTPEAMELLFKETLEEELRNEREEREGGDVH